MNMIARLKICDWYSRCRGILLGVQCACGPLHDMIFTTLATLDSSHDTIRHTLLVLTDSRQGHREHRACAPN